MHQINSSAQHPIATTRPPTVPPGLSLKPGWVRVGRDTYPFTSYAAASAAYCATVERLGVGVSETLVCEVLAEGGDVIAQVAYNGRVFAVGPDGEADYANVLHETRGD